MAIGGIFLVISCLAAYEGFQLGKDVGERELTFAEARSYADTVGKLLLVIGAPKTGLHMFHPCGDVTIDLNPDVPTDCELTVADVRDIPYPDLYFGAVYCSHVLEHLPTPEDACRAIEEMERVSERVFLVLPRKSSIIAWLHPDHHLWLSVDGNDVVIEQR
jgi:hypothetical protein